MNSTKLPLESFNNNDDIYLRKINSSFILAGNTKEEIEYSIENKTKVNHRTSTSICSQGLTCPLLIIENEQPKKLVSINSTNLFLYDYFDKKNKILKLDIITIFSMIQIDNDDILILYNDKNNILLFDYSRNKTEVISAYSNFNIGNILKLNNYIFLIAQSSSSFELKTIFRLYNEQLEKQSEQNPSTRKLNQLQLIELDTLIILSCYIGVDNSNKNFKCFVINIVDNDFNISNDNEIISISKKIDQTYQIYLSKLSNGKCFFGFRNDNEYLFGNIVINDSSITSHIQKINLEGIKSISSLAVNEHLIIFLTEKHNDGAYLNYFVYPFCPSKFIAYPKQNENYELIKAFQKSNTNNYLTEEINTISFEKNENEQIYCKQSKCNENTPYPIEEISIKMIDKNITIDFFVHIGTDDSTNIIEEKSFSKSEKCNLTLIPCYDSCMKCTDSGGDEQNNKCQSRSCAIEHYPLEDNTSQCKNLTVFPKGYFFEDNEFKLCYESCKDCKKKGEEEQHFCIDCKDNFFYLEMKDNYKNCYKPEAIPDGLYIADSERKLLKKCHQRCKACEGGYNSTYNNCTQCPDDYYFITLFPTNCIIKGSQPINYYLNISNNTYEQCNLNCKTCSGYGDEINQNCTSCQDEFELTTIKEKNNCVNISTITLKDLSLFVPIKPKLETKNEVKKITLNSNYSFLYYSYDIYRLNRNVPYVSLADCVNKKLENEYIIGQILDQSQMNLINYSIYDLNGNVVNIKSVCSKGRITKFYPILKNNTNSSLFLSFLSKLTFEILEDIFNPKSLFYSEPCSYLDFLENDISLSVRKDMFKYDLSFCPDNCKYQGYDFISQMIICNCDYQREDEYYSNYSSKVKNSNFDDKIYSNSFYLFKCASVFKYFSNILSSSYTHYFPLVYTLITIALLVLFILFQSKHFVSQFFKTYSLKANPPFKEELNEGLELPEIRSNEQGSIDKESSSNDINFNRKNRTRFNNNFRSMTNVVEQDVKCRFFLKIEVNVLNLEEAIIYDKRNLVHFYMDIIKDKILFFSIFTCYNPYYPTIIKVSLHILIINLSYCFCAMFFSDVHSYKRYNTKIENSLRYILNNEMDIIIYSYLLSYGLLLILDFIMSSYWSVFDHSKIYVKKRKLMRCLLQRIIIQSIIVLSLCIGLGGIQWYFLVIFGYMRKNIQFILFIHFSISILMIIITQLGLGMLSTIMRHLGFFTRSKIFFIFGQIFYFLM